MQSLGADEAVNYRKDDIAEVFKDSSKHFDVVVDLVGGPHLKALLPPSHSRFTRIHLSIPLIACKYCKCRVWELLR